MSKSYDERLERAEEALRRLRTWTHGEDEVAEAFLHLLDEIELGLEAGAELLKGIGGRPES
ncbi:MAG TPA: hypothetical protein VK858_08350 [Longimicrobiales bacterium]|nr:hypothetical protein [Longimicrobiales bacterium]